MTFQGISREFSLAGEGQYDTIGAFWDELTGIYGLESLLGLGYKWERGKIYYAIGLKRGEIDGCNFRITLPESGWESATGKTERLKELYDEIYKDGRLQYETEEFFLDGSCHIKYIRQVDKNGN